MDCATVVESKPCDGCFGLLIVWQRGCAVWEGSPGYGLGERMILLNYVTATGFDLTPVEDAGERFSWVPKPNDFFCSR